MKYQTLQALRAVAANAVLLSHAAFFEGMYSTGARLLPSAWQYGKYGVDLFFVISGFVMAQIVLQGPQAAWKGFLLARIARIYPPYWFFSLMVLPFFLWAPSWVVFQGGHPVLWKSFLLIPDVQLPLLTLGWSLIHEMYFYLVLAALIAWRIPLRKGLFVWSSAVLIFPWLPTSWTASFHGPLLSLTTHPLTLEFILGAAAGLAVQARFQPNAPQAGTLAVLCLLPILASLWYPAFTHALMERLPYGRGDGSFLGTQAQLWGRAVAWGIPCALAVYVLASWERRGALQTPSWLVRLGDGSYSTYLCHLLVLNAVVLLMNQVGIVGWPFKILLLVVGVGVSNGVGMLSRRKLEQPSQRLVLRCLKA